ncbi:tripeptidyl-peptidase [Pseudomassariella vexata]|uniref:tripeptidyl-peptidase II n=1 Tax=Pseudomassariella vexata TaxID=1141098 RepID=A0A1Y2DK83_9PEZI|nr:tripeptidyl-peptidase [Pseudomassariella vexata]ORY59175.1 tripeptidyl-peptidase [Pseudomassariella vexata]
MKLYFGLLAGVAYARVFHSLKNVPQGWKQARAALPTDRIKLHIALSHPSGAALEQAVLEMSTPGHSNYGQHMSAKELRSFTAPSKRGLSDVTGWLRDAGIEVMVDNDWIRIEPTVEQANALLSAEFAWYESENGGAAKLRTLSYSVPDGIADSVKMIQPTTRFGQPERHRSNVFSIIENPELVDGEEAAAVTYVTPASLKSLYNIGYTPSADGNLVAFASYLEEYARYADLQSFERRFLPEHVGQNFSVVQINGGLNDQTSTQDSGEANLDNQYILGVSAPIPITEYSTGGLGPLVPTVDETVDSNEPYLEFLTYLLKLPDADLPQTLSTSYGEEEQSVPKDYALTVCDLFMQLGARGVSVLFSSGDSGPGDSCISNVNDGPFFQPSFPGACPWITSVGATTSSSPEVAVSFSSGGFSIYHSRPAWQDAAVSSYLSKIGKTYSAYFNATGRGFPDVAAQGEYFEVYDQGRLAAYSGTSASAPTFAGVVALLNAARKSIGEAPLGFLNPWLYNNTAALTDITTGAGTGCTTKKFFPKGAAWNATAGWDPVTGLGTPKFDKLLAAAAPGVANK